ncbi:MAG: protein kinase domain-containing protein, partial [Acidimicrobiales bacterium]
MVRGGALVTVGRQLGQGGQGVVVLANLGTRTLALKWFRPQALLVEWRRTIQRLVERSKPAHPAFVWPIDLVVSDETPGFGYLMPYVGPPFMPFAKMLRAERQPDIRVLLTIARELVEAFEALHSSGLCYRDISWGNLLVNPESAEVAIIDNDNVAVDGDPGFVAGTLRFMAPEIIREEAQPSMVTDLHSLAVFLFWLLCHGHPLEGGRTDASLT